jgi:hypothetical protein
MSDNQSDNSDAWATPKPAMSNLTDQPDWLHLKPYGYAPGNYMKCCQSCDHIVTDVDEYARRCKPCAVSAEEIDRLTAERDALREQRTLAESVRAAQVAGLVQGAENLQKAVEYYRAGIEHRAPKWVPSKVWLAGPVRGDYPIGHATIAHEGEYDCESNRYGAISVIAENGQRLGVKPAEFDVLEWRSNEPARAALKGEA